MDVKKERSGAGGPILFYTCINDLFLLLRLFEVRLQVAVVDDVDVKLCGGILQCQTRPQGFDALLARLAVVAHHHVHRRPVLLSQLV